MFKDKLKKLRKEREKRQIDIANYLSVAEATYNRYEKGVNEPDINTLKKLANYFDVPLDYLLDRDFVEAELKTTKNTVKIPVEQLSFVGCGPGVDNNDSFFVDDNFEVPGDWIKKELHNYFVGFARGDSMEDVFISDGVGLIFERTNNLDSGEIGLFHLNGKEYLKRFKIIGDTPFLISENNKQNYDPIPITENDSFEIRAKLLYKIEQFNKEK